MHKILSPEQSVKKLTSEIMSCHNHLGYSATQWFTWMIEDCMAGFGKKLETPWSDEQREKLFSLGKMYAQTIINNPFQDVLGSVYQDLASNYGRKSLGQYFTPCPVASMMAKMNFETSVFESKSIVRVCEPAVGSGVMLLAFMENVFSENPEYLNKLSITCIDLDYMCVKMATLQIMANNLIHIQKLGELVSLHGNTLGDPANLDLYYHVSQPGMDDLEKSKDACAKDRLQIVECATAKEEFYFIKPKGQMTLF